jgi:hypothetical protein
MLHADATPLNANLRIPGMRDGRYRSILWCTRTGAPLDTRDIHAEGGETVLQFGRIHTDLAVAVQRVGD